MRDMVGGMDRNMNVTPTEFSLDEVKAMKDEMVKFVRVAGEYRFCSIEILHKSLVKWGEKALSAGLLFIHKDTFKFQDSYSDSLKVGIDKWDDERLEMILGKKFELKRI